MKDTCKNVRHSAHMYN